MTDDMMSVAPTSAATYRTGWARVIAIDGPAGAGKSIIGARLAQDLGYLYYDTGVLYRAVTWLALQTATPMEDGAALTRLAEQWPAQIRPATVPDGRQYTVEVGGRDVTWELRRPEVEANVSAVSRHAAVRACLTDEQRRVAAVGRVVMVGRDIGTVVLPDAPLKIYLDAALEVRALRRARERNGMLDVGADFETLLAEMRRRDEIDSTRAVSPLRRAADAVVIDTTEMTIDEVVAHAVKLARGHAA